MRLSWKEQMALGILGRAAPFADHWPIPWAKRVLTPVAVRYAQKLHADNNVTQEVTAVVTIERNVLSVNLKTSMFASLGGAFEHIEPFQLDCFGSLIEEEEE